MMIEDGTGTGRKALVDDNNLLGVRAVTQSIEHTINHAVGQAYNVYLDQAVGVTDGCFFYMENTSEDDIVVESSTISVSGATEIYIVYNDKGSRNQPSELTPANLNAGSGNLADGIFEKGSDLGGGAATLSGGYEVKRAIFLGATSTVTLGFDQDLIIPKGTTLTIYSSAAITVKGAFNFNYHTRIGV